MGGNRRVPTTVLEFKKKHKRSKKEIERRKSLEIKLGSDEFDIPSCLRGNKEALSKWHELVKLYEGVEIDYVSSADSDLIAQYCLCFSEHDRLVKLQKKLINDLIKKEANPATIISELSKTNIDNMLNKKREALQKIGEKILLSPTSRIKAIPLKEPAKPADPLAEFGNL